VCSQEKAKYKCPACNVGYCSVGCYKKHKESCSASETPVAKTDKRDKQQLSSDDDDDGRTDITGHLIPKENLQRIKESETIRELLNEPYIQKAILSVMESDDKEKRLNELKGNSEFSILIDELLLCVGVAKRREDGSIEFTGV
ncbi:hypothetical protein WA588_004123, partial [Blastocystis sp. NMH]